MADEAASNGGAIENPFFSVVMPSYNQAEYLSLAIESVFTQDLSPGRELELIVIDGGSTDRSVELLESYGPRIKWSSQSDRGQADALNRGIARARGEVIVWLNSDDVLLPGALEHVDELLSTRPSAQWVIGRCRIIDPDGAPIRGLITTYKNARQRSWSIERLIIDNFISQPAVFVRSRVFNELGPFDETRHYDMDYEYWLRIGLKYEPVLTTRELAGFRMYDTSKSGGSYRVSLKEAHATARRYARAIGKPWLSWINYWYYYVGASTIYTIMKVARRIRPGYRHR